MIRKCVRLTSYTGGLTLQIIPRFWRVVAIHFKMFQFGRHTVLMKILKVNLLETYLNLLESYIIISSYVSGKVVDMTIMWVCIDDNKLSKLWWRQHKAVCSSFVNNLPNFPSITQKYKVDSIFQISLPWQLVLITYK